MTSPHPQKKKKKKWHWIKVKKRLTRVLYLYSRQIIQDFNQLFPLSHSYILISITYYWYNVLIFFSRIIIIWLYCSFSAFQVVSSFLSFHSVLVLFKTCLFFVLLKQAYHQYIKLGRKPRNHAARIISDIYIFEISKLYERVPTPEKNNLKTKQQKQKKKTKQKTKKKQTSKQENWYRCCGW